MCQSNNVKRETTYDGGNRTTKSRNNQNTRRKRKLQILGNTGSKHHQTTGDQRKNKKGYHMRKGKLFETKLYSSRLIKRINTWAVPFVKYSELFQKWTREELQRMDQRKENS